MYWSTNPSAVDKSTIIQHATGQEHFTQLAPDVLVAEWKGGATQGTVTTPGVAYIGETGEDGLGRCFFLPI